MKALDDLSELKKSLEHSVKENTRKIASKLKGTNISLGEQFPKEIQQRRKQTQTATTCSHKGERKGEKGRPSKGQIVHRRETIPSRHVYRHAIGIRSNARRIQG